MTDSIGGRIGGNKHPHKTTIDSVAGFQTSDDVEYLRHAIQSTISGASILRCRLERRRQLSRRERVGASGAIATECRHSYSQADQIQSSATWVKDTTAERGTADGHGYTIQWQCRTVWNGPSEQIEDKPRRNESERSFSMLMALQYRTDLICTPRHDQPHHDQKPIYERKPIWHYTSISVFGTSRDVLPMPGCAREGEQRAVSEP